MLFLIFLTSVQGTITFYSDRHCACSELGQTSCTILKDYCNWNNQSCSEKTTNCSNTLNCDAFHTQFKCKKDETKCIDHTYECYEFQDAILCPRFLGCYWNEDQKCDTFSNCKDYSIKYCPYEKGCITNQGQCTDMNYIDCSSIRDQNNCYGYQSATSTCNWNQFKGVCQQVEDNSECSDLSGLIQICWAYGCYHFNDTCRYYDCSDLKSESSCTSVKVGRNSYKLCNWQNDTCIEAEQVSNVKDLQTCLNISKYNYKWTGECVQCNQLINNSFTKGFGLLVLILQMAI